MENAGIGTKATGETPVLPGNHNLEDMEFDVTPCAAPDHSGGTHLKVRGSLKGPGTYMEKVKDAFANCASLFEFFKDPKNDGVEISEEQKAVVLEMLVSCRGLLENISEMVRSR